MSDSLRPHGLQHLSQASLSITNSQSLLKFVSIKSVLPSNHLVLCRPLPLPSIFPSIRVFSNELVLHIRWSKYWSFSFSISLSNEYSGLIPLGWTGWISLLSKRLSRVFSKTAVQKHQFFSAQFSFIVQLSQPYMTTGKTVALTRWTYVGKVMSLLFNMLSRLVMEKAMASHASTLAWKIPWMEEPGGLQSMG